VTSAAPRDFPDDVACPGVGAKPGTHTTAARVYSPVNRRPSGGDGDDGSGFLGGGVGENAVFGGAGSDVIDADESEAGEKEEIFGGSGADVINAGDGVRDVIDCGNGEDTVIFDTKDRLKDCENQEPVAERR